MPNLESLQRLPLLATTALTARCARRLVPLFVASCEPERRPADLRVLLRAVQFAEKVARGEPVSRSGLSQAANEVAQSHTGAAHAAAYAMSCACLCAEWLDLSQRFPDAAAKAVYFAEEALTTFRSLASLPREGEDPVATDLQKLLDLKPGAYPDRGLPIDPTETGPLGPLWPAAPPAWFGEGLKDISSSI